MSVELHHEDHDVGVALLSVGELVEGLAFPVVNLDAVAGGLTFLEDRLVRPCGSDLMDVSGSDAATGEELDEVGHGIRCGSR